MSVAPRPRRSALYIPGANARALEKARGLAADMIILDLEDAVAPDAKPAARDTIAAALAQGGYGSRELVLRINALDGPWGADDLKLAATLPIHGIVLPKVESGTQVRRAAAALGHAERPALPIWCMMETPLGILRAEDIARSHRNLAGFLMGTSDLAKDLHAHHTRDRLPMLASLGLCLLAARAYGIAILDGVHLDLDDEAGFEFACRQGLEMGFDGKTLIHPKTIDTANRIFAPTEAQLDEAKRMIAAFDAAQAAGKGVVVVDGKLVENLHVIEARRLLALAEMINSAI